MKLIDRIDLNRAGVYYFREILREYDIDPIGLNRHHLINVVARIIVAEFPSMDTEKKIAELRRENAVAAA